MEHENIYQKHYFKLPLNIKLTSEEIDYRRKKCSGLL